MTEMDQSTSLQNSAQSVSTPNTTTSGKRRRALQITGLVAVAGIAGAVGGLLVIKGVAAGKGIAATNAVLATKGGIAAKTGASSLPAFLAPQTPSPVGIAATTSAAADTSIQGLATMLNNTVTNSAAFADQVTALFNILSTNVLPLTAGVLGGGAAGVGVAQRRVRKVQEQVDEQVAKTETLQAETAKLQETVTVTTISLSELQTKLTAPFPAPPPAQDRLEQIHGIGRVFAQRLNAAGIHTLADLAEQTPDALKAIIGKTRAGSMFQPEAWIEEARQLTGLQKEAVDTPTESITKPDASSDLGQSEKAELVLDRLEAIEGITSAIAARLNQSGILTYADLTKQTPAQLASIVGSDIPLNEQDIEGWIQAARELVRQEGS